MKESQVVTTLLKLLKQHGFFWKASDKFHAGIPDIIGCVQGRFVAIEVKIDNNQPTPLQRHYIEKIRKHGGFAEVVTYLNSKRIYRIQNTETTRQGAIEWILKQLASNTNWSVLKI